MKSSQIQMPGSIGELVCLFAGVRVNERQANMSEDKRWGVTIETNLLCCCSFESILILPFASMKYDVNVKRIIHE